MNFKKWMTAFLITCVAVCSLYALINALVDPFGIFGDKLLSYSEYSMTENPRIAKIGYLDRNHEKYDSYVIGCSKSSSIPTEALNKYYNASFYNMIMYGGDLYDIEKTAEYIIKNYTAKNIVVVIGLEEARAFNSEADPTKGNLHAKVDESPALPFYLKYLFLNPEYSKAKLEAYFNRSYLISPKEVFIPETGTYNKSRRDAAKIPRLDKYLAENPDFTAPTWYNPIPDADLCAESLGRIKELCYENGISLTVIASPVYQKELECYKSEEIISYYKKIAEKVDFWNFSGYSDITGEARYFYDSMHFRNCVGEMMLARMFSDNTVFVPDNFGRYITRHNADKALAEAFEPIDKNDLSRKLTVLMYHDFTDGEILDQQLTALEEAGYIFVSLDEVRAFAKAGEFLPRKAVLITIDDGYSSALDVAAPIFEKHNVSAVVSVIGCSVGRDTYKDTGIPITEHFSLAEAQEWIEKGVITLASHTFDMHQVEYDGEDRRWGVAQKDGESEADYLKALTEDHKKMCEILGEVKTLAYPQGAYSELSEVYFSQNGVEVTFTTDWGNNEIVKGIPQTLRLLNRIAVEETTTGDEIIKYIESAG